ncbi:peptide-methionine (S)-S-oxide reductase MsrA [Chromatium okenii]|uniref:peptide-methionine (S)-S-oxide reductase MsrA n=1 Tax=Chromatium okenii TaxID=61644 RepID=UPI0026ED5D13|nr:peptide-methionine (S)-S-oxide reductase MsrA [Chromatium okenii]MBV5310633.1 peptide-methionine (R)-S-oxide reductase MsrB [Chromatium okenii]
MNTIKQLSLGAIMMVTSLTATASVDSITLGMGCFWGAEKRMAALPGIVDVESGYANGDAEITNYHDVLALEQQLKRGKTTARNHAEVIQVRFNPAQTSLRNILITFWENHNPTQGDQQGNDRGSNYRSAIYTSSAAQLAEALATRDEYQAALTAASLGKITTEIEPLRHYNRAEEDHQDYLQKHPNGYCGLGGTGVAFPRTAAAPAAVAPAPLAAAELHFDRQLIAFESADCGFCRQFDADILNQWTAATPIRATPVAQPPIGWTLAQPLFATPTIVLFEQGKEVSRFTGYQGDQARFWHWLGLQLLTPEQQKIAFEQGTERPFTGSYLDEKRPGVFVDPVSGAALFRSNAKFESGSGWPSFFDPLPGAITLHEDTAHGMHRVEVRSASSGIHLGHVFEDGPLPSGKRYCINGKVLRFVPD